MQMQITISKETFSPVKQYLYMFALTLAIQTFHMVEHVAQVIQKFVLHNPQAHGLIGQLDIEQVHFAFNVFYLGTLIYVMLNWYTFGDELSSRKKLFGAALVGTVIVQTYHTFEHTVKLAQFIQSGMQGTVGVLGAHFDGVIFHAVMNTAVFVPVIVVFICAGLHKQMLLRR